MNAARAFVAGIIGAVVMSLIMIGLRAIGVPLHLELRIAGMLGTHVWLIGLIAFIVIGIFLFRIRERFDTVDVQALDRFRGERQ